MQPQEDADQFISVTVLHDSCAWADALATAIISMGQSKAKIWNTQYNYTYH
jgi:thiamine biosynthesis lipoprotein ApbE